MANNYNTSLQNINIDLQEILDTIKDLPEAGGASNDIIYVRVKAESPVAEATIHYTAPDGNVHTITTDNLEGDLQEFEAAAGSAIYIDSYAYLTYSDLPVCATSGNNTHFFFV